ncbi:MAG: hypothetical protein CM1200mP39_25050 [Dehalococcoidia bacterium]|nr:MAG: hypothetical protein CM1200mP39_25050 [Dehalococcoidia bacterium]
MVFQDPYSSLNPKLSAGTLVSEPLKNFNEGSATEIRQRVAQLFERSDLKQMRWSDTLMSFREASARD